MPRCARQRACPPRTSARCSTRPSPNLRPRSACSRRRWQPVTRQALAPADSDGSERRLLRAAFTDAPVPLFLLARDGTVLRVNKAAAELLGSKPGYATGRPFTTFVALSGRAAVQTQLNAVARSGQAWPGQVRPAELGRARRSRTGHRAGQRQRGQRPPDRGGWNGAESRRRRTSRRRWSPRANAGRPDARIAGNGDAERGSAALSPAAAAGIAARRRAPSRRSPSGWTW